MTSPIAICIERHKSKYMQRYLTYMRIIARSFLYPMRIHVVTSNFSQKIYCILFHYKYAVLSLLRSACRYFNIRNNFPLITPKYDFIVRNSFGKFLTRKNTTDYTIISDYNEFGSIKHFEGIQEGIFIDVGANIGKWSIFVGRRSHDSVQVFAVEPVPENFCILKENILLNELENVIPINCALSDEEGKTIMHINRDSYDTCAIASKVKEIDKSLNIEYAEVKLTTIDRMIIDYSIIAENVKLIKIDTEGHELEVLMGARNLLSSNSCLKIIFECLDPNKLNIIKSYLLNFGYITYSIDKSNHFSVRNNPSSED